MTEREDYQQNTGTTGRQTLPTEDAEDPDTALVEIWDRSGQFKDLRQSVTRFREFLEDLSKKGDQGSGDVAQQIALLGKSFANAGRGAKPR